ncbi:DUF5067 domain-containing protein [Staphylococcus aureus]|uniref:DUF5067 domain-containing protein n=2 Tax=Staphylococcus aureus TaxID=1280 RepID=UPI00044A7C4C|nr:DUF5067 domain-containing protein [Staphylococcus aureus]EVC91199.1 hypothetical protein T701_02073 [Staphylococcus aureus WAMC6013]MBB2535561.1 DUF5067 domain-containing protein [Staphylococcus aureus]MBB2556786.1 DUF5067 domain-containing protein [Staphylococcus aureus]MSN78256.1 DUF5067 domain-containing protein [Staphylococcus aureus]TXO28688.1 DUF5067 domain-containing protein [Staphylococcus aureus]
MKRLLGLLLASTLVLGACGSDGNKKESNDSKTSVDENKAQFKNDTLVLDQAVLKIKDVFLISDKDNKKSKKKLIAFKYEVKSKVDDDKITSTNVWIASMSATQDSKDTVNKLEMDITPNTGKLGEWNKHSFDKIKKGGTAKGLVTYQLQNDNEVTLHATKGSEDKKLGTKKIDISKLKTVDYSVMEDFDNPTTKEESQDDSDKVSSAEEQSDENKQSASNSNKNQTQNNPTSNKNNNAPVKDEFSSDTSYNAYQEAKRATEENKRQNGGHTAGIGGSWAVQDGQDYNSWKKAQNDFDNFKRQNSEVIQQ